MYRCEIRGIPVPVVTLHPGEYYSTGEDLVLSTVLGSCVAVALFDTETRIGGLNHFMLPGSVDTVRPLLSDSARYGMYAMELLINDMLKKGVRKRDLRAKVFGAASLLEFSGGSTGRISESNIRFTFSYLEGEGIPVLARDVGGDLPRKIFLYSRTGRVLLKRIPRTRLTAIRREETGFLEEIRTREAGPVVLFGPGEADS